MNMALTTVAESLRTWGEQRSISKEILRLGMDGRPRVESPSPSIPLIPPLPHISSRC